MLTRAVALETKTAQNVIRTEDVSANSFKIVLIINLHRSSISAILQELLLSNSINLSLQNKKVLSRKVASTICVFIGFQGVVFWVEWVRFRRETAP